MPTRNELYLSSVIPAQAERTGAKANLTDLASVHRFVMSLFGELADSSTPRSSANILFRLETLQNQDRLLIQSSVRPVPRKKVSTIDASALLDSIKQGVKYRARLAVNPVQRVARKGTDRAIPTEQVPEWVKNKISSGFLVDQLIDCRFRLCRAGKKKIVVADVDATIKVIDAEVASHLVTSGVGRRKSHGCGLLSLAPLPG